VATENKAKVASLVREAKAELQKGNRDEAFTILRKALSMDSGRSAVTDAILAIEKELMSEKEKVVEKEPEAAGAEAPARAAARTRAPAESSPSRPQTAAPREPAASPQTRVTRETPSAPPAQPRVTREAPPYESGRTRIDGEAPTVERSRPEKAAQPSRPARTETAREAQPVEQPRPRAHAESSEATRSRPEPSPRRISAEAGEPVVRRTFDPSTPLVTPVLEHAEPIEIGPVEETVRAKPRPQPSSTAKTPAAGSRTATRRTSRSIARQAVPGELPDPAPRGRARASDAASASARESETIGHMPAAGRVRRPSPTGERNSVPLPPSIKDYFDSAERALAEGDEAGAVGFLRKARAEAPEDPEVRGRVALMQRRIKAANLIRMGERRLASGSASEALAAAKEAFALLPQAPGLDELVAALEKAPASGTGRGKADDRPSAVKSSARSSAGEQQSGDAPTKAPGGDGAEEYIRKIREQIALNALPNAAAIAAEGLARFPDNELLFTFTDKFRRMRLLPK